MRRSLAVVVVLVASCGGATTEPVPTADAVRDRAAEAMLAVESAAFSIERAGAPIMVSGLEFDSATGVYAAPDRARAILTVRAGDVTARLGTIALGERVWLTDPITSAWNELDAGTGFNPAVVFDPDEGWSAILRSDMGDATVERVERDRVLVRGVVGADRVRTLTAGLVDPQPTEVAMVVDEASWRLEEVRFTTSSDAGDTDWTILLDDYDEPITVEPPTP